MSFNHRNSIFFNPGLVGATLAVIVSVPVTAYLGSLFGNTYNMRVAIYGGLLLWVILGAVSIVYITRKSSKPLTASSLVLWFISTWLWPIPVLTWYLKKSGE